MISPIEKKLKLAIYLLLSFPLLSLLGDFNYIFDLFSHFFLQYFIFSILLLLIYLVKWWIKEIIISFLSVLAFGYIISDADLSWIYWQKNITNPDIMFLNTLYLNDDNEKIFEYIKEIKPKKLALVELNSKLYNLIKNSKMYEFSSYHEDHVFSYWFFSDKKIDKEDNYDIWDYPAWFFNVEGIDYYVIHPLPPMSNFEYNKQKEYFAWIEKLISNDKNKFIVLGDYNSTPYSRVFQKYFWKFDYKIIYSWWVDNPLTIPIDHAVSNMKLNRFPWKKLSSDHIPILINF